MGSASQVTTFDCPNLIDQIVIAALLRVFLAPIFANDNVNENNQGNNGGNSHQTVSINNDKHVANIDSNNGWNSWNSVWDYGNGFIATRILSKKACIIAKINEKVMPDVVELPQLIKEKKKAGSRGPPPVELRFTVSETRVSDLALYGKSVEAMCRGIPTYVAREAHGDNFFFYSGQCFKTNVMDMMTLNYCGETASFR
ncbi:gastrokine-1-like [Natator depressus]|uniref:gastrokine-1-like n=1 Tax=Natator depressus TaxID=27790 RepID=UPI003EC09B0B